MTTKRKILAIAGKMRSGKDTFAEWFLSQAGPDWRRVAFADALKDEVAERALITREELNAQKDIWRPELIRWAQVRREEDPEYWIKRALAYEGNLVIPDLRYTNELATLQSEEARFVRVEAITDVRERRGAVLEDWTSECQLDHLKVGPGGWDWFIFNNGSIKHYRCEADKLIQRILTVI